MRKFKIDKNTSKKIIAYALIGTITLATLTGCSQNNDTKNSLLSNTVLENTHVITFEDGHKDLVTIKALCGRTSLDCNNVDHNIYNSIVTNEYFSDDDCVKKYYFTNIILNKYNIMSEESIISYLTTDEIVKSSKNELTEDDISNIIKRIFTKDEEQKSVQKVK